jgi:Helix-turn-helix domain of resolvase
MSMRYTEPARPLRTQHAKRFCGEALSVKKSLLETLIQVIGRDSTRKIISEFGGARIWVPVRCTPESKLTRILGEAMASVLCARFGGDYLQIPSTLSGNDIYRRIAELHRQGCKINDIALAVGRSRRTVFRLLRKKITDLRRSG